MHKNDVVRVTNTHNRIGEVGAGTTHALVALHVPYQQFRADAASRGLTVNGEQLSVGNTGDPYETKFAFAAATEQSILEGAAHTFVLASDLFIDRSGKTVSRIDVDPGIGIFRTIQPDQAINVIYPSEGEKLFKVRVSYTDGTAVESHSPMYVSNLGPGSPNARFDGNNIDVLNFPLANFPAPNPHLGRIAGATVTVEYAGNDQVLDQPFIVVEGYDPWRITEPNNPNANFGFENFIGTIGGGTGPGEINVPLVTGQTLSDAIEQDGYDLVFVDFDNGTDYIERNAFLVENIIEWVNAQKPAGADDNVVLGMSMGGLVARFALRDMEMNNVDHQTRLYISHDAPHQGANVPVAAQAAVLHLATTSIGVGPLGFGQRLTLDDLSAIGNVIDFLDIITDGSIPVIDGLSDASEQPGDLAGAAALLFAPATRQLLQYAVTVTEFGSNLSYDNRAHDQFMETYRRMGLPREYGIRTVAIASGSECGVEQAFGPYAELFRLNDSFLSLNPFEGLAAAVAGALFTSVGPQLFLGFPLAKSTDIRANITLRALPDQQAQRIYDGRIFVEKRVLTFDLTTDITDESLDSQADMLPLDSSPGGIYDIGEVADLPDDILGVPLEFQQERFCFVPTTSALDIGGDGRAITTADLNARYSPTDPTVERDFDSFFTNPLDNEDHIQFTLDNGQWMLNEMQQTPTVFSCAFVCTEAGGVRLDGPETLCNSATYQVVNTAGQPITWTTSNNLVIASGQGTPTVQIDQGDVDGPGWVEVTVGNGTCQVTERDTIATGSTVPLPTGIAQSGTGNIYRFDLTGAQAGITYSWEVFGEGAVITSGQGTTSIGVEFGPGCANTTALVRVTFEDGCQGTSTISQTIDGVCSNFAIFPNPAREQFTVSLSAQPSSNVRQLTTSSTLSDEFDVVLYDQRQQVVRRARAQSGQLTLNVSTLKPGVYVLHIRYQSQTYPHSVIIE